MPRGRAGSRPTRTSWGRTRCGLLALLQDNSGALTVGELRERGIDAAAQAIYTLELAGYQVDRALVRLKGGRQRMGCRLHGGSPLAERAVGPVAGGISR